MGFSFSKNRVSPIAVDFGADSIKLLQVVPDQPPQLIAAAAAVLPESARNDPPARTAFYGQQLKKLLKQQAFKGRKAILSIPAAQTFMQNIEISGGEGLDTGQQVEAHLRDRLGMDPSRMVVRHFSIGASEGTQHKEAVCLAVPRDVVIRHLNIGRQCKLDVVGMHSVPQAILAAFARLYQRSDDEQRVAAFIDIGAATTTFMIAHGPNLVFAKSIRAAGDEMTRKFAETNNMGFDDARSARMQSVNQPAAAVESAPATATMTAPPQSGASHTVDCLIDELQMCVRYYQSRFPQRPVERLVFLGGESRHTDICQRIARSLRIAAQLGDPFSTLMRVGKASKPVGVDLNQTQPGWAVPYGLCWSEANL